MLFCTRSMLVAILHKIHTDLEGSYSQWLKWIRVHACYSECVLCACTQRVDAEVLLTEYLRYVSGSFSFSSGSIRLISLWIIVLRICTCAHTHTTHIHPQTQSAHTHRHTHTHTDTDTHHTHKPKLSYATKCCD